MSQLQQYYFSVEKLKELIAHFENLRAHASDGKTHLKGFIFTPGANPTGRESIFAFPLYTGADKKGGSQGDIIIQNTLIAPGCPYPPPCDPPPPVPASAQLIEQGKGKGCYDETK